MNSEPHSPDIALLVNTAAGALLDGSNSPETLLTLLRDAGFRPTLIPPDGGTLRDRMEMACRSGASMVVVAGGDGTIACAAEVAIVEDVVLGILPFGTMNLLAKDLGIPVGDTQAAVALLKDGHVRAIDAAEVNGRLYLCASMLGLPARLARYRESARGRGFVPALWFNFGRAALRTLARYDTPRLVMRIDGKLVLLRAATVTITVNTLADAVGNVYGRTRLDGGTLGIYVMRHHTVGGVLRLLIRSLLGRRRDDPALSETAASEIELIQMGRLSKRAIRLINDGESMLLEPPLLYRIRPRALRVVAAHSGA
jgi:diacylglycerol kinase family enzyme